MSDYEIRHDSCTCIMWLLKFAGFVPGTTAVRKAHQIPVDSLVGYLQKELGLHQGGNEKSLYILLTLLNTVGFCHFKIVSFVWL